VWLFRATENPAVSALYLLSIAAVKAAWSRASKKRAGLHSYRDSKFVAMRMTLYSYSSVDCGS
jgi:hypothetical protein